jgi:hypothetical protein
MTAFERIVDALQQHGRRVTVRGTTATAQCPAHDDSTPSLSLRGIETQALMHCHGGCATVDVLAALDLVLADLYDDRRGADYRYDDGRIVHRTPDKRFYQSGERNPQAQLYRLAQVREAVTAGRMVCICEGEKDVHALEALGAVATTTPMGAGNATRTDLSPLAGAHVLIIGDHDIAGEQYVNDIATQLHGTAASIRVGHVKIGKDPADHVAAGYGLDDITQEEWHPSVESPGTLLDRMRAALLDSAGLDTIPAAEPLISGLLYRNALTWVVGKSGHGKSFVALDMAGCIATGQPWQDHDVTRGPVLYVIAEGVTGIRQRVRAWEESYGRRMADVQWLPMAVQASKDRGEWRHLIALAAELGPELIVIDTQARVTVGMEENAAKDMGEFVDQLEKLRAATDACVYVVHHQGRNGEHMRGSSSLDGAADTVLQVSKDEDLITIKNTKSKNTEEHEDITLRLSPLGRSAVLTTADGNARSGLPAALRTATAWWDLFHDDEVSASRLIGALEMPDRTFYRHARQLLDQGVAGKNEHGRSSYYRLFKDPMTVASADPVSEVGGSDHLPGHTPDKHMPATPPIRGGGVADMSAQMADMSVAAITEDPHGVCPNCGWDLGSVAHSIHCLEA